MNTLHPDEEASRHASTELVSEPLRVDSPLLGEASPWSRPLSPAALPGVTPFATPGWIGPYEIVRELGRGGMGFVYLAKDHSVGARLVAVKVISISQEGIEGAQERFRREILNLGRLRHSGIVRILTSGSHRGQPYYVMDYVPGRSLACFLEECEEWPEAKRVEKLLRLLGDVAAIVHYAHTQGVIHRDLKPANIIVSSGGDEPVVLDFGIAKYIDDTSLTTGPRAPGTPSYCAPEQLDKRLLVKDTSIDVWAMGVLAYEAFTGRLPFEADDLTSLSLKILRGVPVRPRSLRPTLPLSVEKIILACLEKDPRQRPQRAQSVSLLLRKALERLESDIEKPSAAVKRVAQPSRRIPAVLVRGPSPQSAKKVYPASWIRAAAAGLASFGLFWLWLVFGTAPPEGQVPRAETVVALRGEDRLSDHHLAEGDRSGSIISIPLETNCEIHSVSLESPGAPAQEVSFQVQTEGRPDSVLLLSEGLFASSGPHELTLRGQCGDEPFHARKSICMEPGTPFIQVDPPNGTEIDSTSAVIRGRLLDHRHRRLFLRTDPIPVDEHGGFTISIDFASGKNCREVESLPGFHLVTPLACVDRRGYVSLHTLSYIHGRAPPAPGIRLIGDHWIEDSGLPEALPCFLPGEKVCVEYDFEDWRALEDRAGAALVEASIGLPDGSRRIVKAVDVDSALCIDIPVEAGEYTIGVGLHSGGPPDPSDASSAIARDAGVARVGVLRSDLALPAGSRIVNAALSLELEDVKQPLEWHPPAFILVPRTCGKPRVQRNSKSCTPFISGKDWCIALGDPISSTEEEVRLGLGDLERTVSIRWRDGQTYDGCPRCKASPGYVRCRCNGSRACPLCRGVGAVSCESPCVKGLVPRTNSPALLEKVEELSRTHKRYAEAITACEESSDARRGAHRALWPHGGRYRALAEATGDYRAGNEEYWSGRRLMACGDYEKAAGLLREAARRFDAYLEDREDSWNLVLRERLDEAVSHIEREVQMDLKARRDAAVAALVPGSIPGLAIEGWKARVLQVRCQPDGNGVDSISQAALEALFSLGRRAFADASIQDPLADGMRAVLPSGRRVDLTRETLSFLQCARNPRGLLDPGGVGRVGRNDDSRGGTERRFLLVGAYVLFAFCAVQVWLACKAKMKAGGQV